MEGVDISNEELEALKDAAAAKAENMKKNAGNAKMDALDLGGGQKSPKRLMDPSPLVGNKMNDLSAQNLALASASLNDMNIATSNFNTHVQPNMPPLDMNSLENQQMMPDPQNVPIGSTPDGGM